MTISEFPTIFPIISTERLILRQITKQDANGIFKNFSDSNIAKWFFEKPFTKMEQVTQYIKYFNSTFTEKKGLTWAIILKQNDTFIGTCGYENVDIGNKGEIGFDLAKEHWRKGLMTEGLTNIIDYGFKTFNLTTLEADLWGNNIRATGLLVKLGFQLDKESEGSHYYSLSKIKWYGS